MAKKKINPKTIAKTKISNEVTTALETLGYDVSDGEDYGFTAGTIVVHTEKFDIQLKPIAPKSGVDRYEEATE